MAHDLLPKPGEFLEVCHDGEWYPCEVRRVTKDGKVHVHTRFGKNGLSKMAVTKDNLRRP